MERRYRHVVGARISSRAMSTTRRGFLATTGLVSAGLLLPPAPAWALPAGVRQPAGGGAPPSASASAAISFSPLPAKVALALAAIERARKGGASHAEARLVAMSRERIVVEDRRIDGVIASEQIGISVRVLLDGSWGFAATRDLSDKAVAAATDRALAGARATAGLRKRIGAPPVELARCPAATGAWVSPHEIDPFSITAADKAALLLEATGRALGEKGVAHAQASVTCVREDKLLVTTDGTRVHQIHLRIAPELAATAVDRRRGRFATRDHEAAPLLAGWEYVRDLDLPEAAPGIAHEVRQKLYAPPVDPGDMHVILAPSNLYLTIHESIGHPTELDRAMGLEANFAGTSFLGLADRGKLQYASEQVTVLADRTQPGGLATTAWDDEGVASTRWPIIEAGVFAGWQTTREQAAWIGEDASRGCSYGHGYAGLPFQRMPNVSLQPGKQDLTTEDLINATETGVYITGRGSWSIDQQRRNFQFGGQMFWKIERGRLTGPLRDVAYQADTLEFWRSCDMLGGPGTYRLGGSFGDGKGEPQQMNAVSHGCVPARFRAHVLRTGGAA